jgi:hypothetical protein
MPGVGHLRAATDGGHLNGGAPRAVWQALGADPAVVSARSAAQCLNELGRASHLVWNPVSGEIIQLVSILRAGRCLGAPEQLISWGPGAADGTDGGWPAPAPAPAGAPAVTNSEGRLCVQICVLAFPWQPFTSGPMNGLDQILDWLDSWGLPRSWPAGRPAAFPHGHAAGGSRRLWARGGHFGASQVPGWHAAGPGQIDIERLTGARAPAPAGPCRARRSSRRPAADLAVFDGLLGGQSAAAGTFTPVP